jgi:hypothetical protein
MDEGRQVRCAYSAAIPDRLPPSGVVWYRQQMSLSEDFPTRRDTL